MRSKLLFILSVCFVLNTALFSCVAIKPPLKPVIISKKQDLSRFKYFISTFQLPESVIPYNYMKDKGKTRDLVSKILTEKNFIQHDLLNPDLANQTMIVTFGETGRRNTGLGWYATEVTIQFSSAKSDEIIFSCTSEGQGLTDVDSFNIAVERCLNELFNK